MPVSVDVSELEASREQLSTGWQALTWSALFFACLQSICTAFMVLSGLRLVVGAGALAAAVGVQRWEATGIHKDAIRYPMMALALIGSGLNLWSLWRVRKLRAKPAAQWRLKPVSRRKLRREQFQIALSILTLMLVGAEWWIHHSTKGG